MSELRTYKRDNFHYFYQRMLLDTQVIPWGGEFRYSYKGELNSIILPCRRNLKTRSRVDLFVPPATNFHVLANIIFLAYFLPHNSLWLVPKARSFIRPSIERWHGCCFSRLSIINDDNVHIYKPVTKREVEHSHQFTLDNIAPCGIYLFFFFIIFMPIWWPKNKKIKTFIKYRAYCTNIK